MLGAESAPANTLVATLGAVAPLQTGVSSLFNLIGASWDHFAPLLVQLPGSAGAGVGRQLLMLKSSLT